MTVSWGPSPMLLRFAAGAIALLAVASSTSRAAAQAPAAASVQSRLEFRGPVPFRSGGQSDSVLVEIRQWSFAGGQRVDSLAAPAAGVLIVELRGGRLTTVIDGRRLERRVGEIWSVAPGRTMRIETGDDMATIQTTLVRR